MLRVVGSVELLMIRWFNGKPPETYSGGETEANFDDRELAFGYATTLYGTIFKAGEQPFGFDLLDRAGTVLGHWDVTDA